jgi:peptidyl-prolyl cis-trans isomerase D
MFEFVRKHTRLTLGFLLLLIIPSFVFFGVEGYSRFSGGGNETVAKVAGQSITRAEWDQAHQRVVDRLRRERPGVEAGMFETPEARRETLDLLLRERTLAAAARELHLSPGDARLQRLFASDPNYAGARNPDGTLNREVLALQGISPQGLEQQLRNDYAARQVLAGIEQSSLATAALAHRAFDAWLEKREVQVLRFDPMTYRAKIVPSDAEIEAHYKAHESAFKLPEQAQVEYVLLDFEVLGKAIEVSDADIAKFYEANAARFSTPEERRASHILINAAKDAKDSDRQAAKAKAEALLAEARKNVAGFAELARKNSQDTGSAANGGDLDFFGRGAMVKPFEDATWTLKKGELSGVVESDFGYHIILLTDVRGGQKKPLESVKAEIRNELARSAIAKKWPEAAEQFTNIAYEQSDSLQPLVDKWKLAKQTATVQRQPAAGASGPLASKKLLDAIFANETLRNKRNTDAIEVGPNQLVAARVVKHEPARVPALAEVKDRVRERLITTLAAEQARKEGLARVEALRKAPTESLPNTVLLSRMQSQGAPKELMDEVLRADPAKLPHVTGVDLAEQGYLVVRVVKVMPRDPVPGGDAVLRTQFAQVWAGAESEAYLAALKKRHKAEIKPAAAAAAASAPT